MKPSVSVILPSRDRPIEVRRAAATVVAQTFDDWELLIIDDGSDPAADVAGLEALDPRITVLRNDLAAGVSRARNRGIAAARGRWLAFLDDDDVWHPSKLQAQLAAAEQWDATFVYTSATVVASSYARVYVQLVVADEDYAAALLRDNVVRAPSSVMVRAEAMALTQGFDPELSVLADWDMWLRLSEHVRATSVAEPLTGVIEQPDSMQITLADEIGDELRYMRARHDVRAQARGARFGSPAVARWHSHKLWTVHRTPWRAVVYGWSVVRCNGVRGTVRKVFQHRAWHHAEAPGWVRAQLDAPVVAHVSARLAHPPAAVPQSRAL